MCAKVSADFARGLKQKRTRALLGPPALPSVCQNSHVLNGVVHSLPFLIHNETQISVVNAEISKGIKMLNKKT